jgi:hypothetical protein
VPRVEWTQAVAKTCRRSRLIAFFSLLVVATSARADCPWVIWVEAPVGSDQWSIAPIAQPRFEAKGDCERRAEALNELERTIARMERATGEARDLYTCLPCTVDPRP